MNVAIILAGGTGTRVGADVPKQYLTVNGKPVISYCLEKFQSVSAVDKIVIVAAEIWQTFISEWITKCGITKFAAFAPAGSSRQKSVLNGLEKAYEIGANPSDCVIIHDAARPNVSESMIESCLNIPDGADGVLPVLPLKDTVYVSENGREISSLLNRDLLFAGQSPEGFCLGKYYSIHNGLTEKDLSEVRGSSEIAYKNKLNIRLVRGDERNYKITTAADVEKFKSEAEVR